MSKRLTNSTMKSVVPAFHGNSNFHAQHSPMGAFMSFTCGMFGARGGIGVQVGKPANHDLFIGVKEGGRYTDAPLRCLPFFRTTASGGAGAADFLVEQAGPAEQNAAPKVIALTANQFSRHYGWATDSWKAEGFTFKIFTPFGEIPNPSNGSLKQMRAALLPAVVAELEIDNTAGTTPKTGVFAINFNEPGWRPIQTDNRFETGFSLRRDIGVVGKVRYTNDGSPVTETPQLFCRWTPDSGVADPVPHLLGSCPGLLFEVPPGEKRTMRLGLGCYLENIVTSGIEGKYFYTRYFSGLADVLSEAVSGSTLVAYDVDALDNQLQAASLSDDQRFMIAHATRSYYGSTQLLDVAGEPLWVVNEGEYCMMNTLDLSVDQVFWELKHNPWVVRNLLDTFVSRYSYQDELKLPDRSRATGGISFCHDMGAHNNFSPQGHSSYELPDLTGCFSYMTGEQLCNWVLVATSYVKQTRDLTWLRQNRATIEACARSMFNRGGDVGFAQYDSSRCGSGSEITTYDSLDHSLAQTRNNLYIAVKSWAVYIGLEEMLRLLGDETALIERCEATAKKVSAEVLARVQPDGTFPAVFESENSGFESRILPAIEGLVYPLYWKTPGVFDASSPHAALIAALRKHTVSLLTRPGTQNLFADGGIKLSSTSNNSWMSKIAIFEYVARQALSLHEDPAIAAIFAKADAAHTRWQTDGSTYWACSDQFVSGQAKGSRYYPRIITAALWMDETPIAKTVREPKAGAVRK